MQKEIDKLQQMKSKAETQKFQLYDDYTKGIVQRDIMNLKGRGLLSILVKLR